MNDLKMIFEITDKQHKKIEEWCSTLLPKILELQKNIFQEEFNYLTCNGKYPYYGTIGGGLIYKFIPTGLGTILKVQEYTTGEEIDVTEYDLW